MTKSKQVNKTKDEKINTIIRTSCHTTKFSNTQKNQNLNNYINEYRRVTQKFVDYIWDNGYKWLDKKTNTIQEFNVEKNKLTLPSMLTSNIIYKSEVDTILTGRSLKCCLTQVSGMLRAETEKQRKRLTMLDKLREEGDPRRKRKALIKRIKENIPKKPNANQINPELNSVCCDYKEVNSKEFDGYIRLTSLTKTKMEIRIPIKHTKHSRKLLKKGKLKTSFLIGKNKVDMRWEITVKKKIKGKTIGADQGMKDVLTCSDKQVTPQIDVHGHSLESIMRKMVGKRKGSKNFKKSQDHRENFVNWSINKIDFSNIQQVNLERIWNINYKSKTSKLMSHWVNTLIRDKVVSISEELGVQVNHQSSTYRSQRCSECGMVRKSNRKGKVYTCKHCGLIIDADYNASKNHEQNLLEIPYSFRNLQLNRKGFFWLESGLFNLEGESLQSLPPVNA